MNRPRNGFTLIEMLVVISIIAILAAILMGGLLKARDRAKSTQCVANLSNLGDAFAIYVNSHDGNFPKLSTTADGFSSYSDKNGNPFYPVEFLCRVATGDLSTADAWSTKVRGVDNMAICPCYPVALLQRGSALYNPCAYSYNRHVDGDGSVLVADFQAQQPGGGVAYCCMRSEGNVANATELCIVMDSADTGTQYQKTFAWKDIPASPSATGSLPNRHGNGANLLFADGHVDRSENRWLRDPANAGSWVIPAADGAWSD